MLLLLGRYPGFDFFGRCDNSSVKANSTGGLEIYGGTSHSERLVKGTRQRNSTPSRRRQWGDLQAIVEIQAIYPDGRLEVAFQLAAPVTADHSWVAQLFSNLIGNAMTYGAAGKQVLIEATMDESSLVLAVSNSGPTIASEVIKTLFQPFSRAGEAAGSKGLGLGLYIASEIAKAHGGNLTVQSSDGRTKFAFTMPITY